MASVKYNSYKQSTLDSSAPDLTTATVKVMACNSTDVGAFNAAHVYLNSVAAGRYLNTTDQTLATKTIVNGTFDSQNPVFSGVAIDGAKNVNVLILYVDTGVATTSPLLAWYDEFTPVTPNGNNIEVQVNAAGWFSN